MASWTYTKGLHELGNGVYAYLQPNGSWGWSNAGLIVDGEASLLVDTLFDLKLTGEMLAAMRDASPAAAKIDTVVNTHANGDHCWGNQLVGDAEIVASLEAAREMRETPPRRVAALMKAAKVAASASALTGPVARLLGAVGLDELAAVTEGGDFVYRIFGAFDFDGIELTPPTRTFSGNLTLEVGDKRVELLEVGPAHTRGDVLVVSPADRTVFTGDILFTSGHPVIWEGPVSNWIGACDRILAADVDVVVPGHGPVTDKGGVQRFKEYLEQLTRETRGCYDAGLSADDAARELSRGPLGDLSEPERLAVNVDTLYRELAGTTRSRPGIVELFARMSRLANT